MVAIVNPLPPAGGDCCLTKEIATVRPARPGNRAHPAPTDHDAERFELELRHLNVRNARLGVWFVMILVPLCGVLDWLTYPHLFWQFFELRVGCVAACVPLLRALDVGKVSQGYHWLYPVALPVLPAVAVSIMIFLSRDPGSPYYAGLCLCLAGTSFVFHWTFREIGLAVGLVIGCFLAATLPNLPADMDLASAGPFVSNSLFIVLTCIILYAGSRQHHAIRRREFDNRCQVEAQREELCQRNEELSLALRRLRETETRLAQSEKLASIGRLSAGIIHEINNPLNYVKMAVFVLNEKAKAMPADLTASVTAIANDINEGVTRVGSIVSDLRSFAHPEARTACPVAAGEAMAKAIRLLGKEIGDHGIQVACDVPADLVVLGDENHLVQILINLVHNSLDALAGRNAPAIEIRARRAGDRVEIIVRDNGTGIAATDLPHIFDPFFTTKEVGQGMGLGLSLCYRMMEQMGGEISVRSQRGKFTEVQLAFRGDGSAMLSA